MLEKLFHLKENKTTVKTEVTAGITSFFTMAYIIFVNPQILSAAGMDAGAVMLATCVASAIGTFLMAFLANYPFALAPTFMQFTHGFGELFNFSEGVGSVLMSVVSVLISLVLVDMFDTIGTLIGTATRANMLDKEGNLPRANGALLADAIATACGAVLGTSTVTTFVESSAGVSEGGRTGLTSLTTGVLFLVAIVASPFLGLVPTAATAPVLIIVGVLMMASVKNINWGEFESALPAFMTIACMPFAYSIADGIAAGFIFFTITKLFKGKAKEVHPIMYVLCVLFILRFIIVM